MQVMAYLEAFADQFNLRPLIRFNTRVVRLEQRTQLHIHAEHEQDTSCSGQTEGPRQPRGQAGWRVISEPVCTAEKQVGRLRLVSPCCLQLNYQAMTTSPAISWQ